LDAELCEDVELCEGVEELCEGVEELCEGVEELCESVGKFIEGTVNGELWMVNGNWIVTVLVGIDR